jgi:hypothetical protein
MPYRHRLWIAAVLAVAVVLSTGLVWATPRESAATSAAAGSWAGHGVAVVDAATHRPVLGLSPLTDGTVIDLSRLAGRRFTLRAGAVDSPLPAEPGEYTVQNGDARIRFTVTAGPAAPAALDVLFVGNSLLGSFTRATHEDTPGLVHRLAASTGRTLNVTEVIHSGYTLRQTWDEGLPAPALSGGRRYDYIVLQEYSTLVATNPPAALDTLLHTYAPAFARALKPGGRVVLFKNWALVDPSPFPSRAAAKTAIDTGYATLSAALPTPNVLAPIGDEFETVIATYGPSYLIDPDGKHPNDTARYLDAATLYGILFHDSPRDLPDLYVPARDASELRAVAATAIGY